MTLLPIIIETKLNFFFSFIDMIINCFYKNKTIFPNAKAKGDTNLLLVAMQKKSAINISQPAVSTTSTIATYGGHKKWQE